MKRLLSAFTAVLVGLAAFAADVVVPEGGLTIADDKIADYAGKSFEVAAGRTLSLSLNLTAAVRLGAVSGAGDVTIANTGAGNVYFGSLMEFTGNMSGTGFGFGDAWSTAVNLNGKVAGLKSANSYNYGTKFWGTDVLPNDFTLETGHQAYPHGSISLNGFKQEVGALHFRGYATATESEAAAEYTLDSTTAATLTVNGGVSWSHYPVDGGQFKINGKASLCLRGTSGDTTVLRGASATDGGISVEGGTLQLSPTFTGSKLTRLAASGTGKIIIDTTVGFPNATLSISGDDALVTLPTDQQLVVNMLEIDGKYAMPGDYSAAEVAAITGNRIVDGGLTVKTREIGEVTTYTWIGGGADDSLVTAANWQGGAAPKLLGGDELLDFSAGTSATIPAGMVDINGIRLSTSGNFALKAADGAKLYFGAGGVSVTAPASGESALTLAVAPELVVKQTWALPAGTKVVLAHGWAGASDVTVTGAGTLAFANDEIPTYTGKLVMSTDGAKVQITGAGGIGALGSCLDLQGTAGLRVTAACATNRSDITFANGSTQGWAPVGTTFHQLGASINACGGARNCYFGIEGQLHFRGGVSCSSSQKSAPDAYIWWWWNFRINPTTGEAWIEEKPLNVGACGIIFGNAGGGCGRLHLDVAGNTYGRVVLAYGATLVCGAENALCPTGDIVYYATWIGALDLGGCDQTVRDLLVNSDANGASSGAGAVGYNCQVKSAAAAALTVTGTAAFRPAELRFIDKAGLDYAGTGRLAMTNNTSTSVGPLKVSNGEVRLCKGATWANCTNVVVTGSGKLTLEEGLFASRVFAAAMNLDIADEGTIYVPEGKVITVDYLTIGGQPQYRGEYTTGFVTGGGTIKVTKSHRRRGMVIVVE